jgi:hypothetical protein
MQTRYLAALVSAVTLIGCVSPQRWEVQEAPQPGDIKVLLSEGGSAVRAQVMESEVAPIPVRERLRPCCAFGSELRAKVGFVPIPGYKIPNIIGPDDVGPHGYDSGQLRLGTDDEPGLSFNAENNGLVYTCRGGFIDTAHVRDYVDWSAFSAGQVARILLTGKGDEFPLPDEGGQRRVLLPAIDPQLLELVGLRRVAAFVGGYVAWYMSVWHELATWFGYRSVPGFSEKASAFSIEDLYSNALGAKLGALLVDRRLARSERTFRHGVDDWGEGILAYLGGVSKDVGGEAAQAVDGTWWDSARRLPDNRLVTRRNLDHSFPLRSWLIPRDRMPDSLRAACGDAPAPVEIRVRQNLTGSVSISDLVTLEVVVDESFLDQEPFTQIDHTVTQRDFSAITEVVRRQILAELGPEADRPE